MQPAIFLALLSAPFALAQAPASPFLSIPSSASDSLRFAARLPNFEVKDLRGRTWRPADFRGKFTLIYAWHPSEAAAADRLGPLGRASIGGLPDLAEIRRFYDEIKEDPHLQVLTFSSGHQEAEIRAHVESANYPFPVIADWSLARTLFPSASGFGPGRIWVVKPEGRLSAPFSVGVSAR